MERFYGRRDSFVENNKLKTVLLVPQKTKPINVWVQTEERMEWKIKMHIVLHVQTK